MDTNTTTKKTPRKPEELDRLYAKAKAAINGGAKVLPTLTKLNLDTTSYYSRRSREKGPKAPKKLVNKQVKTYAKKTAPKPVLHKFTGETATTTGRMFLLVGSRSEIMGALKEMS
jgi:hypothetical protein